jgi:SAM-dependent methyltransferase
MATLKLDFYRGPDAYSEGAVEDELLALVRERADPAAVLACEARWPILYHLAPERRALLEWYPFQPAAGVLEIGAGCGALTGLLCEQAGWVTAVELSEKRSRIVFHRHESVPNLEVLAGNAMDLPRERTFDYVTLIGVLEYARSFIGGSQPARELLDRIGRLLKPGGRLLLAVENRFGLKYFAGAAEDHTGRLFDGIEGYPAGAAGAAFSRTELAELLQAAGYADCRWYYPHPDYKFPTEIFSAQCLPGVNHKFQNAPNYDQDRFQLFSERRALFQVIRDGKFEFFANSFLVDAGRT